jgi:hypothetical protein
MQFHSAYLFDWQGFQREAAPLVKSIDQRDFGPLLFRAKAVQAHYGATPQAWILRSPSSPQRRGLPDLASRMRPEDVDFCFLLLLSGYLQPCPADLGPHWRHLSSVVSMRSGNMRVGQLLTCGWSTLSLLRPERERAPSRDGVGWLDGDTILALQERLRAHWPQHTRPPRPFTDPGELMAALSPNNPVQEWAILAHTASQADSMLRAALEAKAGLFFSYAVEDVSRLLRKKDSSTD